MPGYTSGWDIEIGMKRRKKKKKKKKKNGPVEVMLFGMGHSLKLLLSSLDFHLVGSHGGKTATGREKKNGWLIEERRDGKGKGKRKR